MRFLEIILRVLRLEGSIYTMDALKTSFKPLLLKGLVGWGGSKIN
jgi:hypothetical protein